MVKLRHYMGCRFIAQMWSVTSLLLCVVYALHCPLKSILFTSSVDQRLDLHLLFLIKCHIWSIKMIFQWISTVTCVYFHVCLIATYFQNHGNASRYNRCGDATVRGCCRERSRGRRTRTQTGARSRFSGISRS